MSSSGTTSAPAPEGAPAADAEAPAAPAPPDQPGDGTADTDGADKKAVAVGFIADVRSHWQKFVAALGGAATAVAGYSLAQELGEGDPTGSDQLATLISVVAFGVGAAVLLSVPIMLASVSRATLSSAVATEARYRRWWYFWRRQKRVVGREVLFGFDSVAEFEQAMVDALKDARRHWDHGLEAPAAVDLRLATYIAQREQAELHVAADQVRATSSRAVLHAVVGVLLVVGGYGNATYITNQSQRRAEVHDAARTAQVERDKQILTAALADPPAGTVLPAAPSEVKVVFPDAATAADALSLDPKDLPEACWEQGRAGLAYEISAPTGGEAPERVVLVLLDATSTTCGAVVVRAEPDWIEPVDLEVDDGTTTTTAPEASGG